VAFVPDLCQQGGESANLENCTKMCAASEFRGVSGLGTSIGPPNTRFCNPPALLGLALYGMGSRLGHRCHRGCLFVFSWSASGVGAHRAPKYVSGACVLRIKLNATQQRWHVHFVINEAGPHTSNRHLSLGPPHNRLVQRGQNEQINRLRFDCEP